MDRLKSGPRETKGESNGLRVIEDIDLLHLAHVVAVQRYGTQMNGDSRKRTVKNGRIRTKLCLLNASGIPMKPYDWKAKLPELLLIVGLLEGHSAKEVAGLLHMFAEILPKDVGNKAHTVFSGTVSELAETLEIRCNAACQRIVPVLEQVFQGPNSSLLRMFDLPGKATIVRLLEESRTATGDDCLRVMRMTAAASDGQSGRATRTKLVQLILWDPDGSKFHIPRDRLNRLAEETTDDVLTDDICSVVRASWAASQSDAGEDVTPWVRTFWECGLVSTPCLSDNARTGRDRIRLSREIKSVIQRMDRLWKAVVASNMKHDLLVVSDVTMGITCRIWRFMHHIVEASGIGNGEIAEIAARCQWDSLVTLEWLVSRDDPELFLQYRMYSVGKSKATLERLRTDTKTYGGEEMKIKAEPVLIREVQEGTGIWEQLVNEERGGWARETTYEMAKEISSLHEYEFYFRRLSDIVHGTWRALDRYHLRPCLNPLHGGHYVPWVGASHDAGVSVVHFGIAMTTRAVRILLEYMGESADPRWSSRLKKIDQDAISLRKKDLDDVGQTEMQ